MSSPSGWEDQETERAGNSTGGRGSGNLQREAGAKG